MLRRRLIILGLILQLVAFGCLFFFLRTSSNVPPLAVVIRAIGIFLGRMAAWAKGLVLFGPGWARLWVRARMDPLCRVRFSVESTWGGGTGVGLSAGRRKGKANEGALGFGSRQYEAQLHDLWTDFFVDLAAEPSTASRLLQERLWAHLEGDSGPPLAPEYSYNRTVHTLSAEPYVPDTPYDTWRTLNHGWTEQWWAPEEADGFVTGTFVEQAGVIRMIKDLQGPGGEAATSEVYKYLIMLSHGGVYTDPQTACVRSIHSWTRDIPYVVEAPHLSLSKIYVGPAPAADLVLALEDRCASLLSTLDPMDPLIPPRPHVPHVPHAPETDISCTTFNTRTFFAAPGHPVLLDVLAEGLRRWARYREGLPGRTGETEVHVAQRTAEELQAVRAAFGPPALTKAVLRYLLSRYDVTPDEVACSNGPMQFGEVAILPPSSFAARYWFPSAREARALVWQNPPDH